MDDAKADLAKFIVTQKGLMNSLDERLVKLALTGEMDRSDLRQARQHAKWLVDNFDRQLAKGD